MRLIKDLDPGQVAGEFRGEVRIDTSTCYDFVVSLRALFNPRTFTRSRRWAAENLPRLGGEMLPKGRLLFQGFDTALGYGAARVIKQLPAGAGPADLIDAVDALAPDELAIFMLDTGETSRERLELFRRVLGGDPSRLREAVDGLPPGWATRCRKVLRDPRSVQADLVAVLKAYLSNIYTQHPGAVMELLAEATSTARNTLDVLPAAVAIEHLTGGYTLGPDLDLRAITLAPSVFIYPFMTARIDEETGEALIIYGIPSDVFEGYDPVPMRRELVTALKAMSDPNRLTLLKLLAGRPMYTTELVSRLRLGQPTVHHHLTQLRTAGLIRQERDRSGMKYSIRTDSAAEILRSLEEWILAPSSERRQ
jgi:DNA-binding transcriptional ArsR family regulator